MNAKMMILCAKKCVWKWGYCLNMMNDSIDFLSIFKEVLESIRVDYLAFGFYVERDFVWCVQNRIWDRIRNDNLPYIVYHDYPIEEGRNRGISVDLAVVRSGVYQKGSFKDVMHGKASAEFVAEFKFEPSKMRNDICTHKLPVVEWKKANEDIERITRFIVDKKTKSAAAILVDEFGRYRSREIGSQSKWMDWGNYGNNQYNVSVLWTSIPKKR